MNILRTSVLTLLICSFNNLHAQLNSFPEMNVFEKLYSELIRFIDIPSLKLKTTSDQEEVVIIDYKSSYENAKSQILLYRAYIDCVKKSNGSFTPIMKLITEEKDIDRIIDIYSEYINQLIDYIFMIKHACLPPPRIKLPIYKQSK